MGSVRSLVLGFAIAWLSCGGPPEQAPSRAPSVRVREVDAQRASAVGRTAGVAGDYIVAGGTMRVLVGGMQRRPRDRGRVLAIQSSAAPQADDFEFIAPVAIAGDRSYELRARSLSISNVAGRA